MLALNRSASTAILPPLNVEWIGACGYLEAWDYQRKLAAKRREGTIPDTLLLLEHPPTITLGRRADIRHLLASIGDLQREGIQLVETDRGGDITYHGPGQLVGYPIFHLRQSPHRPDLHAYLRDLEAVLISVLDSFGLKAGRMPGYTGVWAKAESDEPVKVAAIGIKVSHWITMHGFALNVQPNLAHYSNIVPCGIQQYGVTSMAELLSRDVLVDDLIVPVAEATAVQFGLHCLRGPHPFSPARR